MSDQESRRIGWALLREKDMTDAEIARLIKPVPRLKRRRQKHRIQRVMTMIFRDSKRERGSHDCVQRRIARRAMVAWMIAEYGSSLP